jgi:hypothetical protein
LFAKGFPADLSILEKHYSLNYPDRFAVLRAKIRKKGKISSAKKLRQLCSTPYLQAKQLMPSR